MAVSHVKSDTIADLRALLSYDADTGEIRWLVKRTQNAKANVGDLAGGIDDHGYVRITVDGRKIRAHRLVYWLMGQEPPHEVDHINGNRSDNRWVNLRRADHLMNAKNAAKRRDGNTPATGVGFMKACQKWRVRLNHRGKSIFIGLFDDLDQAMAARLNANRQYGFHENHGRPCGS